MQQWAEKLRNFFVSSLDSKYGLKHSLFFIVIKRQNDCAAALNWSKLNLTDCWIYLPQHATLLGQPISRIHCDITLPPALTTSPLPLHTLLIRFRPSNSPTDGMQAAVREECSLFFSLFHCFSLSYTQRTPVHPELPCIPAPNGAAGRK